MKLHLLSINARARDRETERDRVREGKREACILSYIKCNDAPDFWRFLFSFSVISISPSERTIVERNIPSGMRSQVFKTVKRHL